MGWNAVNLILLLGLVAVHSEVSSGRNSTKIVCFLGSWSLQNEGDGFSIDDIDPFLCSHLIYGFANLGNDNRIIPSAPDMELSENGGQGIYQQFTGLKEKNPNLTTMIAIGGWWEASIKYSNMSSSESSRNIFVASVLDFLQKHDFDGLDMSWDFPAHRGGLPEDKENFVILLQDLKEALYPNGYLLSATVAGDNIIVENAYDVPNVAQNVDFINLMTYDYNFGDWSDYTTHISPLYGRIDEEGPQRFHNANSSVHYWMTHGAPANKLVLGLPIYSRLYTLSNPILHGVGDPVTGPPENIPFTTTCSYISREESRWQVEFDDVQIASYAYKDSQWLSFDDHQSIAFKVKYVAKLELAGVMASSIEMDDFRGICFRFRYPFLKTLSTEMKLN